VLTPTQAANIDYALSFDNVMSGGTAVGSVSFRPGDVIGKTGTLGNGTNASEAWFVGSTPKQYSMSVALFTNLQTQNLDNLPATGGQSAGSFGGAWPATIWNDFMTTEFSSTPPVPLFQTSDVNFVPWIQAHPKKPKNNCNPSQNGNGNGNGNGKKAPQNCGPNPNPNPNPSCLQQVFGQPCPGNSPSPTSSCQPSGQCNSPTPTPSTDPSPTPTCTPAPGAPCLGQANTAKVPRKLTS
jgi:membrane peptidoglycan carboxypeptidase